MAEPLNLILGARVREFLDGLKRAATGAETLRQVVLQLQRDVDGAFGRVEATVKGAAAGVSAGLGKAGGDAKSFGQIATQAADQVDAAFKRMGSDVDSSLGKVTSSTAKAQQAVSGLGGAAKQASGGLASAFSGLQTQVAGTVEKVTSSVLNLRNGLLALGAGAGFKAVVDSAADFGQQIAYVGTVLEGSAIPLSRYREQLVELSQGTSKDLGDLTRGLYQTISSGIPAVEGAGGAFAVLEQSQKAAVAGMATTEESVRAISGALNAYKSTGITATEVSDQLFQTVNRGVVEFPELARSLGQVTPIAASFGVGLNEVLGGLASVTKSGLPASEAITGLRQALISIARPPEIVQERLDALGVSFGVTALQEKGFAGVLDDVIKATGGSAQALSELFTDVDGLKVVLALASQGTDAFKEDIRAIGDSAGATDRAYKLLSETFSFQADVLKNKLKVVLIEMGDKILPKLAEAFKGIGDFLSENKEAIAEGFSGLFDAMVGLGTFIASHGQSILTFFVALKAASLLSGAADAAAGLSTALRGVATAAAAGAGAGQRFVGGFAEGLSGFAGVLGKVLRGAGVVGAVVAGGVVLGTELGNAIGEFLVDAITEYGERGLAEIQTRIDEMDKELQDKLKRRGLQSLEQIDQLKERFRKGELVSTAKGGAFVADPAQLKTPEEAAGLGGVRAFNAAFATRNGLLEDANQIVRARVGLEQRLAAAEFKRRVAGDRGFENQRAEYQAEVAAIQKQIADSKALEAQVRKSSEAIVSRTQEAVAAVDGPAVVAGTSPRDMGAGAKAAAKAAKDAAREAEQAAKEELRRQQEIAEEIAKLRADIAGASTEQAQTLLDAERKLFDEQTALQVARLERAGAADEKIAGLQLQRFEAAGDFVQRETDLVRQAAADRVEAARAELEATEAEYTDSLEVRLLALEKFGEARVQAERDADLTIAANAAKRAKDQAVAEKRATDGAQKAQNEAERERTEKATAADARRERAKSDPVFAIQQGAQFAGDVLGTSAETGGIVASIAAPLGAAAGGLAAAIGAALPIIGAVAALPQILDGVAGFLRTGITDWVSSLADAGAGFLDALINGLPDQIDKLFGEVIPSLIEGIIGNLPAVIGGLIALLPRLIAGVVKGIPEIIKAFGRGFLEFGKQIAGFFTSDIVQAIGKGIGSFFADIGRAIWNALPGWGRDFINMVGRGIVKLIKEFFDAVDDATGWLSGGGDMLAIGGVKSEAGRKRVAAVQQQRRDTTLGSRPENQASVQALIAEFLAALKAEGLAYTDVRFVAGQLGLGEDVVRRVLGLSEGQGGTGIGREDRIQIRHQGGPIRGGADPATAAFLANAGVQRFMMGGTVAPLSSVANRALSGALNGDNVPAILQSGEGVLSRLGMRAAGGDAGLDAMNRGQAGGSPVVEIRFEARSDADRHIMGLAVGRVSASVRDPLGRVRAALDQTARVGPPLGTSYVRR